MEKEFELVTDKHWSKIEGQIIWVVTFQPLGGARVDEEGKVIMPSKVSMYAEVVVQARLNGRQMLVRGYISHKVDFKTIWDAFSSSSLRLEEQVLAVWTRDHYRHRFNRRHTRMSPKLIAFVAEKDTLERYVPEDLIWDKDTEYRDIYANIIPKVTVVNSDIFEAF